MRLNFLRIIGLDVEVTAATHPEPAAAPDSAAAPPHSGWECYITSDPASSKYPSDPERARVLAPHTVAEVHDYLLAWEERAGMTLTEEQTDAIVASAESWLAENDQGFLEYIETLADDLLEAAPAPEPEERPKPNI